MPLNFFTLQIFYSFATSSFAFQYFPDWHKPLFMIRQTSFLIGPLMYLYVNSFLKKGCFQFKLFTHLTPIEYRSKCHELQNKSLLFYENANPLSC